jgi:hypothetical protein
MMRLQLIDHDGETVVSEYDLGCEDGQWNVWNDDEGGQLLAAIQCQADGEVEGGSDDVPVYDLEDGDDGPTLTKVTS